MDKGYGMFFVFIGLPFVIASHPPQSCYQDFKTLPAIQTAYYRGEIPAMQLVENMDISEINAQDAFGDTVLISAARCGQFTLVKCLLDKKADTKIKNSSDKNALQVAIYSGQKHIINLFQIYEERVMQETK